LVILSQQIDRDNWRDEENEVVLVKRGLSHGGWWWKPCDSVWRGRDSVASAKVTEWKHSKRRIEKVVG
jgi:hypothetical protein